MLTLSATVRIYLATGPTDLRRGFDGLSALARDVLRADPTSGHLFVFCNRRRNRVKVLYWDRDGLALWYKRLERGTYEWPQGASGRAEVDATELALLLDGVELRTAVRRPRYHPSARV